MATATPPPSDPPPTAAPEDLTLFSPGQIGIAAFLGSAMAGAILLASNFWKLQNDKAAWVSLILGFLATAAVAVVVILTPPGVKLSLGLAMGAAFYFGSNYLQGSAVAQHMRGGGRQGSMWAVWGAGLFCAFLMYVSVFAVGFVAGMIQSELQPDERLAAERVEVSPAGEQVYYTGAATRGDAQKFGSALREIGFFDGKGAKTVIIDKGAESTSVAFVVAEGAWENEATVRYYDATARSCAPSFTQLPIKLKLMDANCTVGKELNVQ